MAKKKFEPSIASATGNVNERVGNMIIPTNRSVEIRGKDTYGNYNSTSKNLTIFNSRNNTVNTNAENIQFFNSNNNTVVVGVQNVVFINTDGITADVSNVTYINGVKFYNDTITGSSVVNWGSIGGTLSAQTDLQTALDAKQDLIATGLTTQYIRGDGSLATFPTIPTVGTWGVLNYPTWVSGTPFVKMTAAGTFALDTNTYLTGNQTITVTGDVTGSGSTSIGLTLVTVNSNVGTYNNVTVNAKGLVTAAINVSYLTSISGLSISLLTNDSGYITSAALSPYLTSSTAASTYQPLLSGTGFVKSTAGTISYDTSTYLTTSSAASTYVPLTRTLTINGTTLDLSVNRSWTVSGSGASLDTITAAIARQTGVNSADNDVVWNWQLTTAARNGLTIGENAINATGTGYLVSIGTLAGSTVKPFTVLARGTAIIDTTATGALTLTSVISGSVAIGTGLTTGTITLGGAAQTSLITLGSSSGTNTVAIGAGAGATTVQIGAGVTNAKTISIGTGAAMANTISIGGTGNNTITINASTSIGSVAILNTSLTGTVNIGNALTTGTINIGNRGSAGNTPTINMLTGNFQSTSSLTMTFNLQTGTTEATGAGNIVSDINIGTGQVDSVGGGNTTQTVNIGTGNAITTSGAGIGSKLVNIGTGLVGGGTGVNVQHIVTVGNLGMENAKSSGTLAASVNIGTGYIKTTSSSGTPTSEYTINMGTGVVGVNNASSGTPIASRIINIGNSTIGTTVGQANSVINIGSTSVSNTYTQTINITTGGANGNMYIGKTTTEKIGFWNTTPIAQPTTAFASATRVMGLGITTLFNDDTFDGYTISQVVRALRTLGILA